MLLYKSNRKNHIKLVLKKKKTKPENIQLSSNNKADPLEGNLLYSSLLIKSDVK